MMIPHRSARRVFLLVGVVLLGLGSAAPAGAGQGLSQACNDSAIGEGDSIPIAGGPYALVSSTPFTIGIEVSVLPGGGGPHVAVCYSTTPYGSSDPALAGGNLSVDIDNGAPQYYSNPDGNTVNVACIPDSHTQGLDCTLGADHTVDTGGGSPALTLTFPVEACFGSTCPVTVGKTGVELGSITVGPGVTLSSLYVFVNGTPVGVG
jgi:hypothetical protein